ncbi:MAG: coenzyme F420-0:L-glutamate ligase [Candidatus Pacebacteria bacterium]|nr:coenzyme F420-0:L-glutamate ligase [Candidatus Paceibacterota bacterium]
MNIISIKTPIFLENDSLFNFLINNLPIVEDGDIVVITSKIVALSENRVCDLKDKEKIILKESKKVIETPWALLTLTNDGWIINAGVDESNADKKVILLPKDSFKTAEILHKKLKRYFSLKKLGVLITDTRSVPLRVGTIGRALGYAGFKPLKSYIDKPDIFGRKSRVTVSNVADALASTAVLVMGEGNEQTPISLIKNPPVIFVSKPLLKKMKCLAFPPEKDIFSKVFNYSEQKSHKISKNNKKNHKL